MILRSFSILNRIDIPATYPAYSVLSSLELPFSILNRIDIPATAVFAISCHDESDFQYPQPDRYPCNLFYACWGTALRKLSVSSTGSISLQLEEVPPTMSHDMNFQYPQPDRYPCNSISSAMEEILPGLSVSSTGSISLQPASAVGAASRLPVFQYPQPDRYPCNNRFVDIQRCNFATLSVSSTGSISLQRFHSSYGGALLNLSVSSTGSISLQLRPSHEKAAHCFHISGHTGGSSGLSARRFCREYAAYYIIARPVSKTVFCPEMGGIFEYT